MWPRRQKKPGDEHWQVSVSSRVLLAVVVGYLVGPCVTVLAVSAVQPWRLFSAPRGDTLEVLAGGAGVFALACGLVAWGPWKKGAVPAATLARDLGRDGRELGLALACFAVPAILVGAFTAMLIQALIPGGVDTSSGTEALPLQIFMSLGVGVAAGCAGLVYYFHKWYRG